MTYRGTVKNGVVVLENGSLSEGTVVHVEPVGSSGDRQSVGNGSALFRAVDHARRTGIPDLAINHDHYLYGHPRVNDA